MNRVEQIVNEILGDDVSCPNCHPQPEGRRKELTNRGWRQRGWGDTAEWLNPAGVYYVMDDVIDTMPGEEWAEVVGMTDVDRRPDAQLAGMDDRADQTSAKQTASKFLSKPKAYMIGDTTTIGMAAGGD